MAVSWRTYAQHGIVLTIVIGTVLIFFAYFAQRLATRSNPSEYTSNAVNIQDSIKIYRNSFGIPHVVAQTDSDAVFGQAWVHAQDRLWQMDVWRRIGQGRLAELFGAQYAPIDALLRSFQLQKLSGSIFNALQPSSKQLLKSYSHGINQFLETNSQALAFEFDALGYKPDPWKPEDCLLIQRVLALSQSTALWNDLVYTRIAQQRSIRLMTMYLPNSGTAITTGDSLKHQEGFQYTPSLSDSVLATIPQSTVSSVLDALTELRNHVPLPGVFASGNAWTIGRGPSGAILANDFHSAPAIPSSWYQIHITSAGMNVVGLSLPGFPLVFSGRNDSLSWGTTPLLVDDADYVVEFVDDTNPNYYRGPSNQRQKFTFVRDTIRIRNAADSLIDLRFTVRGCVLAGFPIKDKPVRTLKHTSARNQENRQAFLTMRWTGQHQSDEVAALYSINTAAHLQQIQNACLHWGAPAMAVTVGHANGTVATLGAGYLPSRSGADMLLPGTSVETSKSWLAPMALADMPASSIPNRGTMVSATSGNDVGIRSLLQASAVRRKRIYDQALLYREMTARDAQVLQQDVQSPYALGLIQQLLPVLHRVRSRFNATDSAAIRLLKTWDGEYTTVSVAATVSAAFIERLLWNTYQDELGESLYRQWVQTPNVSIRCLADVLNHPLHPLFDDIRTPTRENLSWIVVRSFSESVKKLAQVTGTRDLNAWTWGTIHKFQANHPLGDHKLMGPMLNTESYELGGSSSTISMASWNPYRPFSMQATVSARVISDMQDSVQYSVVPGGISGQPMDAHYTDQLQMWLKGGYVRIPVQRFPDITFRLYQLLTPK